MNVVAIIQARMGSSRLPGKVLMDISGASMLSRVVNRTKQAKLLNQIVVATSDRSIDDAVVREADQLGVLSFRGSENYVLDRYYKAAQLFNADIVVRITSDCPLIDPSIIDKVVRAFLKSGADYASNGLVRTYPRGLDVEAFTMSALTKAWQQASNPYERIHVTPYIYENPTIFKLLSVSDSHDYSNYRWTVDTPEDLEFVRKIYERLDDKTSFSWHDILALCEKEPALTAINFHIEQKKLGLG
jgi:spore coat polysaccharide biosynthesis protein SpsF